MADNFDVLDANGVQIQLASDEVGGAQYPRHKLVIGADGEAGDVSSSNPIPMALPADAKNGTCKSIQITLSGTPGTVTTVTVPDTAQGFRLYPISSNIRFAVGEDPATLATSSSLAIAAAAFTAGGLAKADQWETRLLASGASRTVRLASAVASVVVDMEVF